jgi:COP9 signalosome complex subunit 3
LQALDPSTHSLAYLLVLNSYINRIRKRGHNVAPEDLQPGNLLWSKAVALLKAFDPNQIRCAASEWRVILEFISRAAEADNKVIFTSKLDKKAIWKLMIVKIAVPCDSPY